MVLRWVPMPLAAGVEGVLDEPRSSDAVGCPSAQLARAGLRAARSDAVGGCATSSCSAGKPLIGETLAHVGCTAKGPPAEAWTHTASAEGSTLTAEAFAETSAGRTCSSGGRDQRATRRTQASWTEASGKSGGIVYASSRPSYLAYLRMCIRLSRLQCCRGSLGNMAGCPASSSARNFPDLSVGKPGVRDG